MVPPMLPVTVGVCVSSSIRTSFSCFPGIFFFFPKMHCFQRKDKARSNYCNLWSKLGQCPRQIQLWHRIAARLMIWGNLRLHECVVPGRGWNRITTLFFVQTKTAGSQSQARFMSQSRPHELRVNCGIWFMIRRTWSGSTTRTNCLSRCVCVRAENMNSVGRNAF